jgi:hypothetical protein
LPFLKEEQKMNNKRGQFFLIITGVLALILIGLAANVNHAVVQPTPTVFYDLSKNFDAETMKVVDYGIFSPPPNASLALATFIENFTQYAREKDPNIELVYLFGDREQVAVFNSANEAIYTCNTTECKSVGGEQQSQISITIADNIITKDINLKNDRTGVFSGSNVTVNLGGLNYPFILPSNNQFYFILRTEKGKEIHVVTNEQTK